MTTMTIERVLAFNGLDVLVARGCSRCADASGSAYPFRALMGR